MFSLKMLRRFERVEAVVQQRNEHLQALAELRTEHQRLAQDNAQIAGAKAALEETVSQMAGRLSEVAEAKGALEVQSAARQQEHEALAAERDALRQAHDAAVQQAQHLGEQMHELRQRFEGARWLVKDQPDLRLLLDKSSLIDLHVYHHNRWEGDQIEFLEQFINRIRATGAEEVYFFDIGSCWGQYTLVLKSNVPDLKAFAFEANVHNFTQLSANLLLNDLVGKVTTFNRCITDKEGSTKVYEPNPENKGAARVGERYAGQSEETPEFNVPNLVLDHEFAHITGAYIVAKMDIEGSEPGALRGMRGLFERNKVMIQVEDWSYPNSETVTVLNDLGLRLVRGMHPDYYFTNFDIGHIEAAAQIEAA